MIAGYEQRRAAQPAEAAAMAKRYAAWYAALTKQAQRTNI